jgi:hypothetical protein
LPEDWAAVLDDLEARVSEPESGAWTPPIGLGPLPASLHGRAAALAARQQDEIARLAEQRDRVRADLAALRLPPRAFSEPAVYIDTVA